MRILTLLHEKTFTGAPIAGIRTAKVLGSFGQSDVWAGERSSEGFEDYAENYLGTKLKNGNINLADYDLFVCHSAACAAIVSKIIDAKKKVVWWIHEESHFFNVVPPSLINKCLLNASALVFVSSFCAFQTFGYWTWKRNATSTYVIPNFLPEAYLDTALPAFEIDVRESPRLKVLHVGTLGYQKGSDIVLAVAAEAHRQNLNIDFTLLGQIKDRDAVSFHSPNVSLIGGIAAHKVVEHIQYADILLHPTRLDNQPLVVIEALAHGLSVICSTLPSLQEFLGNSRSVRFIPSDHSQIINEILHHIVAHKKTPRGGKHLPYAFTEGSFRSKISNLLRTEEIL